MKKVHISWLNVLIVSLFLVILSVALLAIKIKTENEKKEFLLTREQGVMLWLERFSGRDFHGCDELVYDCNEWFYNARIENSADKLKYYDVELNKISDMVESIVVNGVEIKGDTYIYTIDIIYKPYKEIDSLDIDREVVKNLQASYVNGGIKDDKFMEKLQNMYLSAYVNNCFIVDEDTESIEKELTLTEKEIEGIPYVYNTPTFVNALVDGSHIEENIQFFEEHSKDYFDNEFSKRE